MTRFPIFIDFECSSPDDDGFPIAVCWSLPDGQVKSTLIIPEDHWLQGQSYLFDDERISLDDLMMHGVSPLEVIREMQSDIDTDTVYSDGLGEDEHWLEMMFSAYGNEASFHITAAPLLYNIEYEHWQENKQQWLEDQGLDNYQSEANVVAMLNLHQQLKELHR
ncbi:hypothetical protein [Oceanospirillum sediminis]|uniref:Uncharacterized protein n=1 Tax=Oceanospirillum sediminis TaxID=2760088 RepID=A0A839IMD9_9GAMM|nr:hypothetical protein [Oceanospirillum sediminis]MBB1486061.1 hypothetical protein [Oceanospirillum sediminis]